MGLGIFRLTGPLARPVLVLAGGACVVATVFFCLWSLASAAAVRADSKEVADALIDLGPGDPQTHYAAAVLYEKTFESADIERSLREYEITTRLAPNNYLAWLELGKARERSGDAPGAERAFVRAMDLAPSYAAVQWAYGNSLIRSGRVADGFALLKGAAAGKPEYATPAVVTAMSMFDGDIATVRNTLGDNGVVNSTLALFLFGGERYAEALEVWERIPPAEKRDTYRKVGLELAAKFAGARQFRRSVSVASGVWETEAALPTADVIFNGGFESPVKFRDARLFDWQVTGEGETRIGLSDTQKRSGAYSLTMVFNTMLASDIRQISQTVAVEPGSRYSLEAYYRADLKGSLVWEILDATDGKTLGRSAAIVPAADWTKLAVGFSVPASSDGIVVRLVRDACTASVCPISGSVWFDDLSLRKN